MYVSMMSGRTGRGFSAWAATALLGCAGWSCLAVAQQPGEDLPPAPGGNQPPAVAPAGEVIRERYPEGTIAIERQVIQNEKGDYVNHGPFTYYAPNGKKWGGGEYVLGKRQGVWTRWFYRGEGPLFQEPPYAPFPDPFLSEAHFVNGEIEGPWIIYDRNKQKVSEWSFHAGVPHGVWTWYYPNGQKLREVTYVDGIPNGKVIQWGQDGKAGGAEEYVNGRLRKFEVAWYGPQYKKWEGWYLYGKEKTKTSYDWWKGAASTVVVSVEGAKVPDGKWTWWFPNGQKEAEGAYVAGAKNGTWVWWHPNGQKWIQGDYVLDQQSGKWTWWDPAGKVEKTKDFPVIAAPPGETPPGGNPPPLVEGAAPPIAVEAQANPRVKTATPANAPPVTRNIPAVTVEGSPAPNPTPPTTSIPTPANPPSPANPPAVEPAPAPADDELPPAPAPPIEGAAGSPPSPIPVVQ